MENMQELESRKYKAHIEEYEEEGFKGYKAYYDVIPVSVYGTDKTQVAADLLWAKKEYFATAVKEGFKVPK